MPRTKITALSERNTENIKPSRSKLHRSMINSYFKTVDNVVAETDQKIENESKQMMLKLHTALAEQCLNFPHSVCKTIAELKLNKPEIGSIIETTSLKNASVNTTRTLRKSKNQNYTSKSEDSGDASSRFKTQSNIKKAQNSCASRSLSRSKLQQPVTMNSFRTPISHNTTGTFGLVTPKVKPNTPQVLLRRPKEGEIALSMQGSPLMVGNITSDQKANVNIPLQDGRILSIQPQRGLRTSQIPDIDPETKRQIETLRDNLNKVCAFTARH